jgi:hypothetical protein
MTHSVLVVGHADADGHIIAEQVRRNLSLIENFDVRVVVDPARTRDHKSWLRLDEITEIEDADIIFFVDLMFAPASFAEEATALVDFVSKHRKKKFFLFDHHPLPLRRLEAAPNLRVIYRPEVFECAIGPRSGMMVVAALCEKQFSQVEDIALPEHRILAEGMRRAAALGGQLPGEKLLALLRADCWSSFVELAEDARENHWLPHGRRPASQKQSATLEKLDRTATELLEGPRRRIGVGQKSGRTKMSYDMDAVHRTYSYEGELRRPRTNRTPLSRDLETIVTLLEVAALSLTTEEGATFTRERLIKEAREIGGPEIELRDEDIDIVLVKQGFLVKMGKELRLR